MIVSFGFLQNENQNFLAKTKQNKTYEFAASVSSSDTRGGEKEKGKKKKEKYSSSVIRDSTGNWIWFVGDSEGCPEKWL